MLNNPRSSCYLGCGEAEQKPLHCFPKPLEKNEERFNIWKSVLDKSICDKGDQYVYNQIRLCHRHFENYHKTRYGRLTRNAIPTLHLRKESTITTEFQLTIESPMETLPSLEITTNPRVEEGPSTSSTKKVTAESPKEPLTFSAKTDLKRLETTSKNQQNIIHRLTHKVLKITNKYKSQQTKMKVIKKLSQKKSFLKIVEAMPETVKVFINMQLKGNKKAKGRKFSIEEKVMAASILKQSNKAYNFLQKIMVLPSKRTLQRLLKVINIKPGLNKKIMIHLKKIVSSLPVEKRLYTLLFDEVALSPGLYFNKHEIIGFEDFGHKKTKIIADHALVLMIKGVKSKTKQPILFTFCKSATKNNDLKTIISNTVKELKEAGIIIVATICDQGTSNVSTIKMFQKETREKYLRNNIEYQSNAIEIENMKIYPLFDTPHLLKGIRNNFLTKNIKFIQSGKQKIAKWEHLKMLLNEDKGEDEIRILNKLTEYHVHEQKIPKMKVKYAAQIFSQRVSAVMRFLAGRNVLPAECEDTADLLLIFDKLFDSFNGHSYCDTAKILKGCLKNNSPHIQFWTQEIIPILKTLEFEKHIKNKDGTEIIKYEKVPSVQNWIHNINTTIELWNYLHTKFKIKNIIMRNFNQDPLENFFCCIRSNGIRNVNPTCMQFINAFKTVLINNINSCHSISANCEKDDYEQLQSLKFLLLEKCDSPCTTDFACEIDSLITALNEILSSESIIHTEAKRYVAGYIIKKCKSNIFKKCRVCNVDLLESERNVDSFNYAIDYTKRSLFYARDDFVKLLNEIYFMIVACLRDTPQMIDFYKKVIFFIDCRCDFAIITCKKHKFVLVNYIIKLSINLIINSWCTGVNRLLNGKIVDFDRNDEIKLQAYNYNKTHRKKKC